MKNTRQWWFAFGKVLVHRVKGQQLPQVASSLTFTTVLSLIPLVTVMLAVFTAFPIFERVQASLQAYLMDSFFPDNIASTIIKYVNQFSAKAKGLTLVGIVFLIVTAFSTMLTVDRVFNRIWHVKRHRRLADKVLLYWALMSFSPILLGFSLSASSAVVGRHLSGIDSSQGGFFPVLELISFLITVGAFAFSYRIIPHRAVHWRDALFGGLVASMLFEISKRAFAAYVIHFPSYTALYGVLAAFPLFLIWVYLSWLIILLGACCAAALPDVRVGVRLSEESPSLRWFVALALLSRLEWGRQNQQPRQTLGQLGKVIPVSAAVLDDTLNDLLDLGLVGLLAGDNNKATDTFSLICESRSVSMSYLAQAFWFNVEDLKQWRSFFLGGASQMEKIHQDFLEKASLHDWFSLEKVTHK